MPLNVEHSNPFLGDDGAPVRGVCCVCGCEDDNACNDGCWWVNEKQTLCSACLEKIGPVDGRMVYL